MRTLLLDNTGWDFVVDADGNIAVADVPYAYAQDAASAIRLFLGELWYDTTRGVSYWTDILGKAPPLNYMRQKFETAALTVPGIKSAKCYFLQITNRVVTGQVQISDQEGKFSVVTFARTPTQTTAVAAAGLPSAPSLDFSQAQNSQYLPGIG